MFITLEGPEGSGKSSQIEMLAAFLRDRGLGVIVTREPGGTLIGDKIRDVLHDVNNKEMSAVTEFLLYSASRAQLVEEVIGPALNKGKVVLCDRYTDSSLAYQGYGRGLPLADLSAITRIATQGLKPDLTLLLDIEVERGLGRRVSGDLEMNRLDLAGVSFHERVREGYHLLAAEEPQRWRIIDADQSPEAVQDRLQRAVVAHIPALAEV